MVDTIINKIKKRIRGEIVRISRGKWYYPYLYVSYWHYLFSKIHDNPKRNTMYYSAKPNSGAGIGHQMANWIAGYWYAKFFRLNFANMPFSTNTWDNFLGFGSDEISVKQLKKEKYIIRRLPLFDENNKEEIEIERKIISSYSGQKIVFVAEQDQFLKNQYLVMRDIKEKFYSAQDRAEDKLIYCPDYYNIAIHVRRGDILNNPNDPNLKMRFLSNDYYCNVLRKILQVLKTEKEIHIYLFSQGNPEDYSEFNTFKNVHWCLEMNAQQSFLHFVYADLLITSKSSFSYKPALINNGIKVCPRNFWHGYPKTKDWILCENDGTIAEEELLKLK